ncbi:MAG: alpha/beta fold hydrolase, partial [Actinomyces sp.]|nr:alpha/beta fold hydrolase [Actinomyces sp.]
RDDFYIVLYDLPGHGGTPIAPVDRELKMTDVVEALLGALDDHGVDTFHCAGLSLGGMVAMATAITHPQRVRSLTVMSAGPINGQPDQWYDKAGAVRRDGTASLVDATFERWFMPEFASGEGADRVEAIRRIFENCDDEGYAQCCEVLASTDMRGDVASIHTPTLLISAEEDGSLNWAGADELARTIRSGGATVQVARIPQARHMSAVEKPELVARALKGLVD